MDINHIYPTEDLREHDLIGADCWCHPYTEVMNSELIVIHNSMDDRESYEEGRKLH